ncbi:MAG TPA: hypothetical protein VFE61_01720 [Candidatus Sulfotelmatobacter sp.]|jgi:hypothetical protein|nr:hypothetical protein [Candidatus Sulfotelmatobacter sp.]
MRANQRNLHIGARIAYYAVALLVLVSSAAAQRAEEDPVANLTLLSLAKTHDESCDVLDSRGRAAFRRAALEYMGTLSDDEAARSRMRKSFDGRGPDRSHDCSGSEFLNLMLWTFRDAKGEDPRPQFKALMTAKDYELKCHVLPTGAQKDFYLAGRSWITNSVTNEQARALMYQGWDRATPLGEPDCTKDEQAMLHFMVTWTFRAKTPGR